MNRFCRHCGAQMTDEARFCFHCGAMADVTRATDPEVMRATDPDVMRATDPGVMRVTDPDVTRATDPDAMRVTDPEVTRATDPDVIKLHAGATVPISMTGLIRNGFRQAKEAISAFFVNPKQLIPIIVLAALWLVLGILQAFGISPWPLKVLSFLTFAQGGLFGGFWGAIGGIIGKAIFAYFVSVLLLPLFTGKTTKMRVKEGIKRFIAGFSLYGLGLVAALLMGIGASLIVFNFLSGNASLINSMPGLVGFVLAVRALISRSGFFWNTLLIIANKLSKGRTPEGDTVHRFVSGFAVGGLAGVGLSSLPWPYLPYLLGLSLVIVGIVLGVVARSRREAVRI